MKNTPLQTENQPRNRSNKRKGSSETDHKMKVLQKC